MVTRSFVNVRLVIVSTFAGLSRKLFCCAGADIPTRRTININVANMNSSAGTEAHLGEEKKLGNSLNRFGDSFPNEPRAKPTEAMPKQA